MGLSRRVLADGEDVVYEAHPHWWVLATPVVALLAVVAALIAVAVVLPGAPVTVAEGLAALGGLVALWLAVRVLRWRHTIVAVTTLRVIERSGVLSRRGEEIRLDRIAELTYHQSLLGMLLGAGRLTVDTGAGGLAILDHVRRPARLQSVITDQIVAYQRSLTVPAGSRAATATPPVGPVAWDDRRGGPSWDTPPAGTPAVSPGVMAPAPTTPGAVLPGAVLPGAVLPGAVSAPATVAERMATLRDLHLRGLVDDTEFAAKRAQLLDQL